jgi:hypothetical protein
MKSVLAFAAVAEAATGLVLLLLPSVARQLPPGAEMAGTAVTVARVAGIALIALSATCWPGTPLFAMLGFSAAVTLYLACLGLSGASSGVSKLNQTPGTHPAHMPWDTVET